MRMNRTMRLGGAAFSLSALLVMAACGGDVDTVDDLTPDLPVPAAPGGDAVDLTDDDADVSIVDAVLAEWSVTLSRDSVPAGVISFDIRNAGTMAHRLEVEGNGMEWETGDIPPGGTVTMSINLAPGLYEVYCPVETQGVDHEERGMKTTLRVH